MTNEELRDKTYNALIPTIAATILASLILFIFQSFSKTDIIAADELKKKASIEYVDKQDGLIEKKIDDCDFSKKASIDYVDKQDKLIRDEIDGKLDLILKFVQEK